MPQSTARNQVLGVWRIGQFQFFLFIDEMNTDAWPNNYASAEDIGYRGGQNPFSAIDYNNRRMKIRKVLANFIRRWI